MAGSQGNVQALEDGGMDGRLGEVPYVSEFAAGGQLLFDAHLPAPMSPTARTGWRGAANPQTPPALAAVRSSAGRGAVVYASWNGATRVASWRVLAGTSPGSLAPAGQAPRRRL